MKDIEELKERQSEFISGLISKTRTYINTLDKKELQTILLSGSVSRGDYFPGEFGGKVDIIVLRKPGSILTAEELFGKDEEPEIPYHCVTWNGIGYQILFSDFINENNFIAFDEARKYSFLESQILWDENRLYEKALQGISSLAQNDQTKMLDNCLGYISYLLSDYKKDRWLRRDAFSQMHENLNTSIRLIIQCLFYINNKYSPAEDRRLYYSYSLPILPKNYNEKIRRLFKQVITSKKDYFRREKMFIKWFLDFVNDQRPIIS
jgi:hypothetical protein